MPPSTLDLTLGALEVGTLLSIGLYGLITLQVYIYPQGDFKDHVITRLLVFAIWILDTIHTILLCIFLYHLTVTKYGQPSSLNDIHWSCVVVLLLKGIMAVSVQSFFAYRIKILSGRLFISIFAWLVCVVSMGMNLVLVILAVNAKTYTNYVQRYEWTIPTAASTLAFGDLLNTSAICFFLSIRKTGHTRTDYFVNKLIHWAVETGLITTICAVITVVLCTTMPRSLTWIGLFFFFPKFYSISLLISLNNRQNMRRTTEKSREETLASAVRFSISRVPERTDVEMVPMKPGNKSGDRTPRQKPGQLN